MKWTFIFGFLIISFSSCAQSNSASSYFVLGNEAFEQDKLDEALYYYEKAALLEPNAEDIRNNILVVQENLSVDIVPIPPIFLSKWWGTITGMFLPGTWKLLTVFVLVLFLVMLYVFFFGPSHLPQSKLKLCLYGAFILFLLCMISGFSRHQQLFDNRLAVVMGGEMQLKEGPDTVSEDIKAITGGIKVQIIDASGDWYKVASMDKEQGWMKKNQLKLLKFE